MKKMTRAIMLAPMNRYLRWIVAMVLSLAVTACGTMRSSVVFEPAPGAQGNSASVVSSRAVAPAARTPVPGGDYVVEQGDTLYSIAFRKGVDFRDLAQWNGIAMPYTIWPGQRLTLSPAVGTSATATRAAVAPPTAAVAAPVFEPVPSTTAPASAVAAAPTPASPVPAATAAKPTPTAAAPAVVPVAGVPVPVQVPPPAPAVPAGASHAAGGVTWRWPAAGSVARKFKSGDAIPGIEIAGKSGDPVRAAADGMVVYSGNGLVGYGELVIIKHSDSFLSAYGHNRKRLVKEGQRVSAGQQIAEMGSTGATRNELQFQIRKDGNPVDPLLYLPAR